MTSTSSFAFTAPWWCVSWSLRRRPLIGGMGAPPPLERRRSESVTESLSRRVSRAIRLRDGIECIPSSHEKGTPVARRGRKAYGAHWVGRVTER
jgi:hypothetical protein